jgi:hypothetical protein
VQGIPELKHMRRETLGGNWWSTIHAMS